MATEIGRSLEEIDNKVKNLNKTLKASADETKALSALQIANKVPHKEEFRYCGIKIRPRCCNAAVFMLL
ncbi:MAG: hypothetical protein LBT55_00630 [Clostridiaceae bacterium]|jgi:hypothetical protein|nr:hypothetical protein [Clostridiaceae bacterium]